MSGTDIAKAYDPSQVETRWYKTWLEAKAFAGVADPAREPFCIVIPPPNVTGVLHMGHVLNNTIQDILVRRARQEGKAALWLPGTDHAGLATQTQVEKDLRKQGLDRRKMGREKFFERVVEWRDKHGGIIIEQLKRLGCSCDWDRNVHTLDPGYSRAVLTAFVKLYERGHIYRGLRMVNWCPKSLTALSDEEVIPKPQKGFMYHMRYEIVEKPGEFIKIATTRPETLMGDTAVAVHPDDPRYKHLHGCHVWRPFPRAQIPIIFDAIVDKEFGSGALKVTPAHDKVDFEIGQRHKLPIIDVLNPDGTLNALGGEEFNGVERFKARKMAAEKLRELGLLDEEKPYENTVGFSERADVPIEPRLSEQWFLKYPRIEEAKKAVEDGHVKFWPEHWKKVYVNWLDKIQDWCISRQVWWGHRIPVWYKKGSDHNDPKNRHVSVDGPPDPQNWEQDEDSLDTWASSWLWPFGTLGWPEPNAQQAKELKFWYPTNDLVTGPDIIFFWVARMIIAGLEFMNPGESLDERIPFKNVYFTGIVRDKQGRKMSKSLGNSPDPIDLINRFGADALRFGTVCSASQGNDVLFDELNVEQGRNFCNKLWNAARFRQMQGATNKNGSLDEIIQRLDAQHADKIDKDILRNLVSTTLGIAQSLSMYQFNMAAFQFYGFFWNSFCDTYLEIAKNDRLPDTLVKSHILAVIDLCLRQILLLLHSFMPHITEELWHELGFGQKGKFIQDERLTNGIDLGNKINEQNLDIFESTVSNDRASLNELFFRIGALKSQHNVAERRDVKLYFAVPLDIQQLINRYPRMFKKRAGASVLTMLSPDASAPGGSVATITALGTVYLELTGLVDKNAEKARLSKELENLDKVIAGSETKLANEAFTAKAPANVIEGARKQLAENQTKREELRRLIAALG